MVMAIEATTVSPTTSPNAAQPSAGGPSGPESHIDTFFDKAVEKLKTYETQMQEKFASTVDGGNALLRMPEGLVQEIDRLEGAARTPEERAIVERFKKGVTETFEANREHIIANYNSKMDSAEMKLGAAFVTKTVQGVQQLLSAT